MRRSAEELWIGLEIEELASQYAYDAQADFINHEKRIEYWRDGDEIWRNGIQSFALAMLMWSLLDK